MRSSNLNRIRNPHLIDSFQLKSGQRIYLADLEKHGLSFVPCDYDSPAVERFGHLWNAQKQVTLASYGETETDHVVFKQMQGVQIMTGQPTFLPSETSPSGYLYLMDFDIECHLKTAYPEHYHRLITAIYELHGDRTPCHIKTKSDGDRFSLYVPGIDKKVSYQDSKTGKMLFEFFSKHGLSRLDNRYALVNGSLFDIPQFHSPQDINSLTNAVCDILNEIGCRHQSKSTRDAEVVETSQIGELNIDWVATTIEKDDGTTYDALVSQFFPTENCYKTEHKSNRNEVSFTKFSNGSILGKCFNCGETWWEVKTYSDKQSASAKHKKQTRVPYQPTQDDIAKLIAKAPPIEVVETPSFPHFSKEERTVVDSVLGISPDAGWHGETPVFTTRYEYLHPLTNKFALNGQPSQVEKHRVWCTIIEECDICGSPTARWVDGYTLIAGRYCDGCHKDYLLGSYLEYELGRKLPNSIVSEHQGFLGNDPEFADFRLWEPGVGTYLGAAMSTGKSTETYKRGLMLASHGLGKVIIAVPSIALACFLAYQLRKQYGSEIVGLWHEGCDRSDRFIGEMGAITCVPSLPRVVELAKEEGAERIYIAIDEIDFSYNLLSLTIEQSIAVKDCLRESLHSDGLVFAGQTMPTLSFESIMEELDCDNVQGFYNTAPPADGIVTLHKHPDVENKSNSMLCAIIDKIKGTLELGLHAYVFVSTRRAGQIIAEHFAHENPVFYNAYTKGSRRCQGVLWEQKLTDSNLFIATSAAGVGISILDKKARTIIQSDLLFGSRHASMKVQESMRDRGRMGIDLYYPDYVFRLPVKPSDNERVSLYHELLKNEINSFAHLSEDGIKNTARTQALASLADVQFEAFVGYHLGVVGNMEVNHEAVLEADPEDIQSVASMRKDLLRTERQQKIVDALEILTAKTLLTSSEIRIKSNQGGIESEERIAHEFANACAQSVGWNDKVERLEQNEFGKWIPIENPFDDILDDTDIAIALRLCENNINTDRLVKQRRGYLAVQSPDWIAYTVSEAGNGLEITAVDDDRFLGKFLKMLLQRLNGTVFDATSLANATREVLKTDTGNRQTFGDAIIEGTLGASEYRKARFLQFVPDETVVEWVSQFISDWYPARIQKQGDHYGLVHAEHIELKFASFRQWLRKQPSMPAQMKLELDTPFEDVQMPESDAELKEIARFRRQAGESLKSIAEDLGRHPSTVGKWCDGIKPQTATESDILSILGDGEVWKTSDIVNHSRFARQKITIAIKKLLDIGTIHRVKRGCYQKTKFDTQNAT